MLLTEARQVTTNCIVYFCSSTLEFCQREDHILHISLLVIRDGWDLLSNRVVLFVGLWSEMSALHNRRVFWSDSQTAVNSHVHLLTAFLWPSLQRHWKSRSVAVFCAVTADPFTDVFPHLYNLNFATIYYIFHEAGGFTGFPINHTVFMPVTSLTFGWAASFVCRRCIKECVGKVVSYSPVWPCADTPNQQ